MISHSSIEIQENYIPKNTVFNNISKIQKELENIKFHLKACIESLMKHNSIFIRASTWWSTLKQWQKMMAFSALIAPLVIGVATQLGVLITLGTCLLLFGGLFYFLFENYLLNQTQFRNNINMLITRVINILETLILNLEISSNKLALEIEKLHQGNKMLTTQCAAFEEEVTRLNKSNQDLKGNNQELIVLTKHLQTKTLDLEQHLAKHKELLQLNQELLSETSAKYQTNLQKLEVTLIELNEVKKLFTLEVNKTNRLNHVLNNTLFSLTEFSLVNKQQCEDFFKKLDGFLICQETRFDSFAKEMAKTPEAILKNAQEMTDNNKRINALLEVQERQIQRLESIAPNFKDTIKPLKKKEMPLGLFDNTKAKPSDLSQDIFPKSSLR